MVRLAFLSFRNDVERADLLFFADYLLKFILIGALFSSNQLSDGRTRRRQDLRAGGSRWTEDRARENDEGLTLFFLPGDSGVGKSCLLFHFLNDKGAISSSPSF
jgi:hypothetical protein